MKRLTVKRENGYALLHDNCPNRGNCYDSTDCVEALVKRLGEYEDTGFEPEGIYGLCEMEKRSRMAQMLRWEGAESEGRLFVLPCKVGDTVMAYLEDAPKKGRNHFHLSECKVSEIMFSADYPKPLFTVICKEKALFDRFWVDDFNKEVFTLGQYWTLLKGENV